MCLDYIVVLPILVNLAFIGILATSREMKSSVLFGRRACSIEKETMPTGWGCLASPHTSH